MGCCPSKHKTHKGDSLSAYSEYPPTEKIDIDYTPSERGSAPITDEQLTVIVKAHDAPRDMLMDRGDGRAVEKSDHEIDMDVAAPVDEDDQADLDMIAISVRPAEATSGPAVLPPLDFVEVSSGTPARSTEEMPSPVRSPSRPPINYEDMPINSMYHRIHVVEVEEMEAKRRQELQEEAERREREIQEFRAAMQTPSEG